MKRWTDENGTKRSDPDCADEWLFEIWAIGCDYDGRQSAEELKQLVGELVEMAQSARECLRQGKLFGVYGGDVPACGRYARQQPPQPRCIFQDDKMPGRRRCMATKDMEPCIGYGKCLAYKPEEAK